ncbi:MAG: hypothetical protein ACI3W5_03180 [Faecousia sp.]
MKFQGALVKEQGVTFGIVVVKPHVLHSQDEMESMRMLGVRAFGAVPIILMAQNSRGIPTYSGRRDIVNFLASVPMHAIPWREYTLS